MSKDKHIRIGQFFDKVADTYDVVHVSGIDGGILSKDIVATLLANDTKRILDLGIGSGLELVKIFERFTDVEITGIDLSTEMLKRLKDKYPNKKIDLICDNYFNYDFCGKNFDAIISVMSLHHFTVEEKFELYKRIFCGLKTNGLFINSDYIIGSEEEQIRLFSEYDKLKQEREILHFDTPLTEANEIKLLRNAGFSSVKTVWSVNNNKVIVANK